MGRFLKQVGVYILLFLCIATIGDLLVSYRLKSRIHLSEGELHTWQDIYEGTIDADIAIYGSSRAWVHIDPTILKDKLSKETYNFGIDGFHLPMQLYRHQEYFKYNSHPKHIVFCVDWFSFLQRKDLLHQEQFLPYMLFNYEFYHRFKTYEGVSLAKTTIPFYRYLGDVDLYKELLNESHSYRVKGYKGIEKEFKESISLKPFKVDFDQQVLQDFVDFIEEIKKENIQLTLVITPLYIKGQDRIINIDKHLTIIDSISKEYELPLLDYTKDTINFDKELFYNNMHLNKRGAEQFSARLAEDLKSIMDLNK